MICYKDMCFCPFWEECVEGKECHRALTEDVREGAKEWMGENAPISMFADKPDCFREAEDE